VTLSALHSIAPTTVQCRPGCGACCIAPSITSPMPGLPNGKPAGVRCLHLDDALRCRLWGDPRRPAVCDSLKPAPDLCGDDRDGAMRLLARLEVLTAPSSPAEPAACD
jgi:hypothetical protein